MGFFAEARDPNEQQADGSGGIDAHNHYSQSKEDQVQGDESKVVQRMVGGVPEWGFDCARGFAPYGVSDEGRIGAYEIAERYRKGDKEWCFVPIANCPLVKPAEVSGVQATTVAYHAQDCDCLLCMTGCLTQPPTPRETAPSDGTEVACRIIRDVCELEPADANSANTVRVSINDLGVIVQRHVSTAPADAALDCVRELREALMQVANNYALARHSYVDCQVKRETNAELDQARILLRRADALLAQGDAGAGEGE